MSTIPTNVDKILCNTGLIDHFSDEAVKDIVESLTTETFQQGDIIIREGEIGDRLFIILDGAVRVFTHNQHNEEIVLARIEKGSYFGEQALLTKTPLRRNACVRALTDVTSLTLSHAVFHRQLQSNLALKQLLEEQGGGQLVEKLTKQLQDSSDARHSLQSFFSNIKHFRRRQVFFRQGDLPADAYFLLRGSVAIRFYDDDLKIESQSQVKPGQFFGELGLLKTLPRRGTAVALSDVEVCVIDGDSFREAYANNRQLKELINATVGVYHVPTRGLVTQYQGRFLEHPAIQTTIQKPNKETLVASRVINADIFAINYVGTPATEHKTFEDDPGHIREITIAADRLVGVVSIGYWDDLGEISQHVYNKSIMSKEHRDRFSESGNLVSERQQSVDQEDELCTCMHVKVQAIQSLILEGAPTLEAIAKTSGAGNVCGGCRPRILELLGGKGWIYAKIVEIREHNAFIRGFRLQPIDHPIKPYYAGQHLVIEGHIDDNWVSRSYTLTSTDTEKEYYEITVKRESMGLFSRWLFDRCRVGEILRITEPQGAISFSPETSEPAVCFVAGIGITPAIAFAKRLVSTQGKRPLYIDYSVRSAEIAFSDELVAWSKDYSSISTKIRCTDVDGRLTESQLRQIIDEVRSADFYICGPSKYEETVTNMLKQSGVDANRIHVEKFIHAGGPPVT